MGRTGPQFDRASSSASVTRTSSGPATAAHPRRRRTAPRTAASRAAIARPWLTSSAISAARPKPGGHHHSGTHSRSRYRTVCGGCTRTRHAAKGNLWRRVHLVWRSSGWTPSCPLPTRAHAGDAGVDLYSAVDVVLAPGRARPGVDRYRGGDSGGHGRIGPSAVGIGGARGAFDRQQPRHHRRRIPRRDQGDADQSRSRGAHPHAAAATGSRSCWFSGSNCPSWSRCRRSTRPGWLTPPVAKAATVLPADMRVCDGIR